MHSIHSKQLCFCCTLKTTIDGMRLQKEKKKWYNLTQPQKKTNKTKSYDFNANYETNKKRFWTQNSLFFFGGKSYKLMRISGNSSKTFLNVFMSFFNFFPTKKNEESSKWQPWYNEDPFTKQKKKMKNKSLRNAGDEIKNIDRPGEGKKRID